MTYFEDLNPYLVRQTNTPEEPAVPLVQTYVENILRVNIGKKGTFYFSYSGSKQWTDMSYTGVIEQAGRDHVIIRTDSNQRIILLFVYLLWATFDEPLDYQHK